MKTFSNFTEFYPYYLSEHENLVCRRLHFAGSWLAILSIVITLITTNVWWLVLAPIGGYGFAWAGHFVYENNKPATFHYPLYSLRGDWKMFADIVFGRVKI